DIEFDFSHGKDFKRDLSKYSLIIQCGGCMLTRSNMMVRINRARMAGVPITNYGVALAYLTGALDRVVY
ncbi:MAG: [FeFe] hydrogenase H-cluster maturation GTPase HydF, partial [Peptostreptococcus anaerobius]